MASQMAGSWDLDTDQTPDKISSVDYSLLQRSSAI